MSYKAMKELFGDLNIEIEDLYLLESFQIAQLESYAPKRELSAILHKSSDLVSFFSKKNQKIIPFIERIMENYPPAQDQKQLEVFKDKLLWEIALNIIINKSPYIYDERVKLKWDLSEISNITKLNGKIIADVGAGTGNIAFTINHMAEYVYAIEPASSFRQFIRDKAKDKKIYNLYPIDGLLHEIPLPNASIDVLITSNAIGWFFKEEMQEIERVIKPKGCAIHLLIGPKSNPQGEYLHNALTSSDNNYSFKDLSNEENKKLKYWKFFN
ncbi:MAG: class I SAM-dependent methyltransferase [archaeon]|nr:class I SAM-dependent methyltransferase [archaeon]